MQKVLFPVTAMTKKALTKEKEMSTLQNTDLVSALEKELETQLKGGYLKWQYKPHPDTGKPQLVSLSLSDDSELTQKAICDALKSSSGTEDCEVGERILLKIASGLSAGTHQDRLNEASAMLSTLEPKSPTEALLLGQYLALQDAGMKCLKLANSPDQGFYHIERLFILAHKLMSTANQTMQTILKYRTGGQQVMQVVHLHNEGQAIVAQNLSSNSCRKGDRKKNRN